MTSASTSHIVDAAKAGEHELTQRRKGTISSSSPTDPVPKTKAVVGHSHSHAHAHAHGHGHHHHDHGSAEEADALLAALKGKGDRGSNITLAGLVSNIGLCGAKGVAGVYLNSAALLADAAHSLSDMFADLVTLFCWKMSQKPPSASHPLGYGKYETMGSLGVSLVLVAGAVGIGFHSYGLLLEALQPTLAQAPAAIQAFGQFTNALASAGASLHDHHHHDNSAISSEGGAGVLDPNAMWFALLSIVVKEWLYHATLKIAKEENSSVLEANALHHRSDSLSSGVTFLAIGGSWLGFPVLDPLGGLLVAGLIGKQGADLLISALGELSDRGVEPETLQMFDRAIVKVKEENSELLLGWKDLRAVKSGVSTFADVTLQLPTNVTLKEASVVEEINNVQDVWN
uniref:Related to MMT1-Mitochondrial iron transport protein n=1 Tax=Melanopsichium pennsylvanicum 4 TaxID=1398559 RepID=A0A077QX58_9BASI|nr:related to MMT1-Mitochondrial iron transport protein [Melanopsichium pennsylvanicum 4]